MVLIVVAIEVFIAAVTIAVHENPTFSGNIAQRAVGLPERSKSVVFSTIDSILMKEEKLPAATTGTKIERLQRNEETANAAYPTFLKKLDKKNTQVLRDGLDESDKFGELRKQAIEALLDYRDGLFTETKTTGINLKNTRKSSKCHFSEQMVAALFFAEPAEEESYSDYITRCIATAEERLNYDEKRSWKKGFFSHRLRDLIEEIKEYDLDNALTTGVAI